MANFSRTLVLSPVNLDRSRRRLTRLQNQQIRDIFQFLELPAELRNVIYHLALSFKGIETFFNNFYAEVKAICAHYPGIGVSPPKHLVRTPTILLLNRQIHHEAVQLLCKQSVHFDHGLLSLSRVQRVISHKTLRNITSLHITTKGHPIIEENIGFHSFTGYIRLFEQLASLLFKGHKLEELVIDLTDKDLAKHVGCWKANRACEFRNTLNRAFTVLRTIRGVEKVEVKGVPAFVAEQLEARIKSTAPSIEDMPANVRGLIYYHAADWSDISSQLTKIMANWTDSSAAPPFPKLSTPTILLLNKQISKEALSVLKEKPLTLTFPTNHNFTQQSQMPNILRLISPATLAKVQHFKLYVNRWQWMFSVKDFLKALAQKPNELRTVKFVFKDSLKAAFMKAGTYKYPDPTLHNGLKILTQLRGMKRVTISGDLPSVYAMPLRVIMESPASITDFPKLLAVRGMGEVVEADGEDDE